MIPVIRYIADDGTMFLTEKEALQRDDTYNKVESILRKFYKRPRADGYVQQIGSVILEARELAIELSEKEYPHPMWREQPPHKIDPDVAIEYLKSGPIRLLWSKLSFIDSDFRDWGNSYFVKNPDLQVNVKLEGVLFL